MKKKGSFSGCVCSGKSLVRFVRPVLLAFLAKRKAHGYELMQQLQTLTLFSDDPVDASGVYKVLKEMEKEGLLTGQVDAVSGGPSRRVLSITAQGRACLKQWRTTLRDYHAQVGELVGVVRS